MLSTLNTWKKAAGATALAGVLFGASVSGPSAAPVTAAPPAAAPGAAPDVSAELKRFYEEGKAPDWKGDLARLSDADPAKRKAAAAHLRAVLDRAYADELSGAAPWRATPFWGSSGENPARNLRTQIAGEIAKAKLSAEALPVLRWMLETERLPPVIKAAGDALAKVTGPEADGLLAELATAPHRSEAVAVMALEQAVERKAPLDKARVSALCNHHRQKIRLTARAAAERLGLPAPGPFDPAKALRSPGPTALMERIDGLVPETAPADAPWVVVAPDAGKDGGRGGRSGRGGDASVRGWLVAGDPAKGAGAEIAVLTPHGRRVTLKAGAAAKADIAEEVARVEKLRAAGDPDFELCEQGVATGQFLGHAAGLYEVSLGHWLWKNKRDDLAARILIPAMETRAEDGHLYEMAKDRFGDLVGRRMLVAFVGDRDYAAAAKLAETYLKAYPDTRFTYAAKELARQLPLRGDDFKALKLPAPAEWAAEKGKLSRPQQIEYLCKRLRLLNSFQFGQPGGVDFAGKQYAEPCGLSDDAAWGLSRGKTEVINPLKELDDLKIAPADFPTVAAFLKDDWLVPCVGFWRDFHPGRNVYGTRGFLARMINVSAGEELVNPRKFTDAAAVDAEIARISQWGRDNASKPPAPPKPPQRGPRIDAPGR
jgi:hypothetical protein